MKHLEIRAEPRPSGHGLVWTIAGDEPARVLEASHPVILEVIDTSLDDAERICAGYDTVRQCSSTDLVGKVELVDRRGMRCRVEDHWTRGADGSWQVDRRLEVVQEGTGSALRLVLELAPLVSGGSSYADFHYFAPGAIYDLNDLDGDHVNDYLDTQTLVYRDDRLSAMSFLAYHAGSRTAYTLSRADAPQFDPPPARERGQATFLQKTDIGSLGVLPGSAAGHGCVLTAAYPFVERDRSFGLLLRERPGWGSYWPLQADTVLEVSYALAVADAPGPLDALWATWLRRMDELHPQAVQLDAGLDTITAYRIEALQDFYAEGEESGAAGFVTNCHPQDGRQLGNVIQYGFTGQQILNAIGLLRAAPDTPAHEENRRRALRVIEFFVQDATRDPRGLAHGLYNLDRARYGNWWMGVLLPLSYAEPGGDLEALMGPLYERFRPVIEALQGREGTYLRCLAEEYEALLQAYEIERDRGTPHPQWLAAAQSFARFLAEAQEPDGSFYRAYDFQGRGLTDPDFWFGQTDVQRKSSTATVVPFLARLHRLTGDTRWLDVAGRASSFVYDRFVAGLKFNGGVQDSFYAKPQAVDHESIIFAFRALLEMHRATGEAHYLTKAVAAAWVVCTWAWLWDVPLPEGSTFERFGFRSTGWTGCDVGAGYIHPMGVIVVPDLVEVARLSGEPVFARMAELILAACNENVALPAKDWGYARPGLQEEGQLISWCWADDPMFDGTAFGGRGKGEGNKTCYPWISAVGIWSYQELMARYGTAEVMAAATAPL